MEIYSGVQKPEYARDLCLQLRAISESQISRTSGEQVLLLDQQVRLAKPGNDIMLPKQNDFQFCTWYDCLVGIPGKVIYTNR
jgi:hypothetical protein